MAKLVLFLKTDVLPREKHTSTRLVELKDLLIIRFYTIFPNCFFNFCFLNWSFYCFCSFFFNCWFFY